MLSNITQYQLKHIKVIDLGHFLWWSIGTKSVSLAVYEIPDPKHIWVTTLTFHGHVTSSVT